MSSTIIHVEIKIDGTLTDVTSVKLRDPDDTFGVKRLDTDDVVIDSGTDVTRIATGTYELSFDDPAPGLLYTYWVEYVYLGATYRFEKAISSPASAPENPVDPDDEFRLNLIAGDDYTEDAAVPSWTISGYSGPSMDGATGVLRVLRLDKYNRKDANHAAELEVVATIAQVGDIVTVRAPITSDESAALFRTSPSDETTHEYQIIGTTIEAEPHTIKLGPVTVTRSIEAAA